MKFIIDRASDGFNVKPVEVEMNTLGELIEFIKENWKIILSEEEERVRKYAGDELECNKYHEREKTWRLCLTIYDDYVE